VSNTMRRMTPKIKRTEHSSANDRLGAGADGQLQEDMLDVRFHCLRRDLKSPCDAFIGAALADHCEDIAFSRSERIADAAAHRGHPHREGRLPTKEETSFDLVSPDGVDQSREARTSAAVTLPCLPPKCLMT
jgi:hypothetical protein